VIKAKAIICRQYIRLESREKRNKFKTCIEDNPIFQNKAQNDTSTIHHTVPPPPHHSYQSLRRISSLPAVLKTRIPNKCKTDQRTGNRTKGKTEEPHDKRKRHEQSPRSPRPHLDHVAGSHGTDGEHEGAEGVGRVKEAVSARSGCGG